MNQFIDKAYSFLDTKYNWSLIVLTLVIYFLLAAPYSSNANYDMPKDLYHYFIFTNIGILVASIIRTSGKHTTLTQITVLSLLLQIITILSIKTVVIPAIFTSILIPLSIFVFLYLLKETARSII